MNRRGELEQAASNARMPTAAYAFLTQLLRRCGNDTGKVPSDDAWRPPLLETLARQAKIHRVTAYRALAALIEHGWFERRATADRARVAGVLTVGRDFGGGLEVARVCQRPGCGEPLTGMRSDARYHSPRCKKAGQRLAKAREPVAVAGTDGQPASSRSRDMSPLAVGTVPTTSRDTSSRSRDKPQASSPVAADPREESSDERVGSESPPVNGLVPCAVCGEPMDPTLSASGYATHPDCDPGEVSPSWPPGSVGEAAQR